MTRSRPVRYATVAVGAGIVALVVGPAIGLLPLPVVAAAVALLVLFVWLELQ